MGKNMTEEKNTDWAKTASDGVIEAVTKIKEGITKPFKPLLRFLAYLPLIILTLAGVLTLLIIGVFRIIDNYLPQPTWLAYFIMGGGFVFIGSILWLKRPRLGTREKSSSAEL